MAYKKHYTAASVKLAGRRIGNRVHLLMVFNYSFKEGNHYETLKHPTGHAVEAHEWDGKDFTPQFKKKNAAAWVGIMDDVATLRTTIFKSYDDLKKVIGHRPHPEAVLAAMRKNEEQITPVTLADYIREICQEPSFNAGGRTVQKYITTAMTIDLLTGIRKAVRAADGNHPLHGWVKGDGPVMLANFNLTDWNDINAIIKRAAKPLTVAARGHKGVEGLVWTIGDEPSIYSVNSLEKFQQQVKAVIHYAIKTERLKAINTSKFEKVQRNEPRKPHLTVEEVIHLVQTRFSDPILERTRQIMVVQVFSGVAVSNVRRILEANIQWVSGRTFNFPMINDARRKTGNPCAIPVFRPLLDILQAERPEMPTWDQQYNDDLKRTAKALGFDRVFFRLEHRAHGETVASEVDLAEALASHAMRRTTKNFFQTELQVHRDRCCDMMGHAYADEAADRSYLDMPPERSAELFIKQVMAMADEVCPELDLIVTKAKEVRQRA